MRYVALILVASCACAQPPARVHLDNDPADVPQTPRCEAARTCHVARFDPGLGDCVEEPAPDGTPCEAEGLCPGPGECRAEICVQTEHGALEPIFATDSWSGWFLGPLLADHDNNLYLNAMDDNGYGSVVHSWNSIFVQRWQARLEAADRYNEARGSRLLALAHGVLIGIRAPGLLVGLRTDTGGVLWSRDLIEILSDGQATSSDRTHLVTGPVLTGSAGVLYVSVSRNPWTSPPPWFTGGGLVAIDASSGVPLWRRSFEHDIGGASTDEEGNVYFSLEDDGALLSVASVDADGVDRWWRNAAEPGFPAACAPAYVHGPRLVCWNRDGPFLLDASNGAPVGPIEVEAGPHGLSLRGPAFLGSTGYLLASTCADEACVYPVGSWKLFAFDLNDGRVRWEQVVAELGPSGWPYAVFGSPIALPDDSILFLGDDGSEEPHLYHVDDTGTFVLCRLPEGERYGGKPLLTGRRLVTVVRANDDPAIRIFDLAGRLPAPRADVPP